MPDTNSKINIPYLNFFIQREVAELYVSSAIRSLGVTMIALYEPLYFYSLGFPVKYIILYYAAVYFTYFLLLPLGGKIAVRFGFEHAMLYSIPFRILYYLTIYLVAIYPPLIFLAVLLFASERAIYWPSYHANLAFYGNQKDRGKEVGIFRVIGFVVAIAGPLLGGIIINQSNFTVLFIVVSILFMVSVIPMFTTREKFTPGKFIYRRAFKRLFSKENRKQLLGYLGLGEDVIAAVIWPIFIFLILDQYFSLGVVISLSTLFTIIINLVIGRYTDTRHRSKLIKIGGLVNMFVWIFRIFIKGPVSIFFTDALYRVSLSSVLIPIWTKTYSHASKTHRYMKTVIFFEQSVNLSRTMLLMAAFGILLFTDRLELSFIPPAITSLLYLFI